MEPAMRFYNRLNQIEKYIRDKKMTEDEAEKLRILPGVEPIHDIVAPIEEDSHFFLVSFDEERNGYLLICLKRPPSDILGQSTSSFISTQDNS